MKPKRVLILSVLCLGLLGATGLGALRDSAAKLFHPLQKAYYLAVEDAAWIRPGLKLVIQDITIPANRKPVVRFKITDQMDQPLDRAGVLTPGVVTTSFVLAYLPAGETQYKSHTTRVQTSPITRVSATQAASDSGGTYQSLGDGIYTYTFGTTLPDSYERGSTHTLGIYSTRDLREWDLSRYVVNALKDFVPDGRQVTVVRDVTATVDCNQCHNPLALHGGSRRDVRLCVLCHTPQTTDPDTGLTMDFKVMVHKIHRGKDLPSVVAGKPYVIIGNAQSVHDYSTVAFPQDIRNCDACHNKATQAGQYLTEPTRDTCGSCHDNVNFKTGDKHAGGAQADDRFCARCHWDKSDVEYDSTVAGAHIAPYRSTQLIRPKAEIVGISNAGAGQKPVVQFKLADKNGAAIEPARMTRLALTLAGPTTDYKWYLQESAMAATVSGGVATYTFTGAMPADAKGTYVAGVEGYVNTTLNPGTTKSLVYRDALDNVTKTFAVTGSVVARRQIVDQAKCNACHEKLQLHGNNRNGVQYCTTCHNPTMTDAARRPASAAPNEGIEFKHMIHRIHSGEELNYEFKVAGAIYNEVRYPGDRRDCTQCHVGTTYTVPVASGLLSVTTPRDFINPSGPVTAACLGCHDSKEAAAHAYSQTAAFGESCAVCHKETAEYAVSKVHAR